MKFLRAILIAVPLGLTLSFGLFHLAYNVEPTHPPLYRTLPVLGEVWPGGDRYRAGSFPEWEVRLPNGRHTRLKPTSYRRHGLPQGVCVALRIGRWTRAFHIRPVAPALCTSAPQRTARVGDLR